MPKDKDRLSDQMLEVMEHVIDDPSGHSDRETLAYLFGQGYAQTVGALRRRGLVSW